ncbi:hypothetical protein XENTR_v10016758 [Xenopus tropicalis]|nr:hypothetical protein XENTR_v10016758 [Xenopus tropicalis]
MSSCARKTKGGVATITKVWLRSTLLTSFGVWKIQLTKIPVPSPQCSEGTNKRVGNEDDMEVASVGELTLETEPY